MEDPAAEAGSAETDRNECPQCGAKLDYAPGTSILRCPYCKYELPIRPSETGISELDYSEFLERAGREKESCEARRIQCDKCGAETTLPVETVAEICPFCGANMFFSEKVSRLIRPEGLLPFKVSQKEAGEFFRRWMASLWLAPNRLKEFARSDGKLTGVYVPFWTFDSDATTAYRGERGDYYYTTETRMVLISGRSVRQPRRVRHTRWRPAGGTLQNSFNDVLILASKSLPRQYGDRLDPWDLSNLVSYKDEYLSGFRAETYRIFLPEGFEAAKAIMASAIEDNIRRDIGGDEQRVHSAETQYAKITFKHILLPVWLTAYRYRDRVYRILINGRTGEVQGDRPFSAWKIAGAVVIGLMVLAILAFFGSTR